MYNALCISSCIFELSHSATITSLLCRWLFISVADLSPLKHNNITPWAIKTCHFIFVHNFEKRWPILKILSLLDSAVNLQQGSCHTSHLNVSLHYLVKYKRSTIAILLIDLLLNIKKTSAYCLLSSHIKCSKCPYLAWTHAQRRLFHSYIASSMTLCPKPCQTFVRRCFSSSTSWI